MKDERKGRVEEARKKRKGEERVRRGKVKVIEGKEEEGGKIKEREERRLGSRRTTRRTTYYE